MIRRLGSTVMVLAVLAAVTATARADQTDARLDALFRQLGAAPVGSDASALEHRIWRIWVETADAADENLMRQGIGAMAGGQLDLARGIFDRLVDQAPGFAEAWNKRATIHYLTGDYAASVADIQKVLELEPRHFGALSGLGLIYDALGESEAALRSFEAALAINPHLEGTRERALELRKELRGRRV